MKDLSPYNKQAVGRVASEKREEIFPDPESNLTGFNSVWSEFLRVREILHDCLMQTRKLARMQTNFAPAFV